MSDVSKEYGAALYELASDEKIEDELLAETDAVKAILRENAEYVRLLSSPTLRAEEKEAMLCRAFGEAHPYLLRFLRMMVSLGYARELVPSFDEYRRLHHEKNGISEVTVTAAAPLSEEARARLIAALEKRYGIRAEAHFRVDPALLGGVRVEMEGVRLDGTVRRRLAGIGEKLSELTL